MKGEVIDFEVLRIQSELENYSRTETLPHLLLNGAYNLDDIFDELYVGVSVPKRNFKRAVDRNKIKRQLRIALKKAEGNIPFGVRSTKRLYLNML